MLLVSDNSLFRANPKEGADVNRGECFACRAGIACLQNSISKCDGDAIFEKEVRAELAENMANRKLHCEAAGLPDSQ